MLYPCLIGLCCFQWFKDTNLKANHNNYNLLLFFLLVVSNGSKILIWKQITTIIQYYWKHNSCFQWFKDTNLKANHNCNGLSGTTITVVSNGSKILIWKQITTNAAFFNELAKVVSNGSKILIWKQITTQDEHLRKPGGCFQWFKDTNLKANHNTDSMTKDFKRLFPMVQRY